MEEGSGAAMGAPPEDAAGSRRSLRRCARCSARTEGWKGGRKEGRTEGRKDGRKDSAAEIWPTRRPAEPAARRLPTSFGWSSWRRSRVRGLVPVRAPRVERAPREFHRWPLVPAPGCASRTVDCPLARAALNPLHRPPPTSRLSVRPSVTARIKEGRCFRSGGSFQNKTRGRGGSSGLSS